MLNKTKFISITCALFLSTSINAKELNLDEILDIALKNNTNIQVSKYQEDIKTQELKKAKSAYLPKLSASADIGNYDIEASGVTQEGDATSVTLSASQLIYDFGKTSNSIDASKYNLEASSTEIQTSTKDTILSIKEAYYDILNKHQQIIVAKEAVSLDKLQLSQANEYFKAGVRTKIDVINAQLNLSNSELKLVQANYDLKISKTKLISLLGTSYEEEIDVKLDSNDISSLAKSIKIEDENLAKLINTAFDNRSELQKYKALIKTNKANLNSVKAEYYPTLDVSASYSDKNSDDISSLEQTQTAVLLNLKWDLFTGDTTSANKKISLANLSTTKKQFEQQKLQIRQDVTSAYLNLEQSFESIKINLLSLDLSTRNLNLANERYKAGLNDLLEVNDAKLEYTKSKTNLVNSYYTYLSNTANLEYSLGLSGTK